MHREIHGIRKDNLTVVADHKSLSQNWLAVTFSLQQQVKASLLMSN